MSRVKILIVEDEPVIAENIAMYLNNHDFEISGIAYDSEEAIDQLKTNTPDAVILDINLDSEQDGIDIASYINSSFGLPYLFLTSYSDKATLDRAKAVKPSGYIVKPFNEKTLQASLEIALSNHATEKNHGLPELIFDKVNVHLPSPLSQREFQIVQLIYEGCTNSQMTEKLFVSINTIKTHLKNIYLKLDATSRLDLIYRLRELMKK